jgi:hypothetical protein
MKLATTACPVCFTSVPVPATAEPGSAVECPTCEIVFEVPAPATPQLEPPPLPRRRRDRIVTEQDDDRSDVRLGRRRKTQRPLKRRGVRPALLIAFIAGGTLILVVGVAAVIRFGDDNRIGSVVGHDRDPKFDRVTVGMTEDEVVRLLDGPAWDRTPGASGIWTFPRSTFHENQENPNRKYEIQDVIFVYFRNGKVADIYRKTGAEFRQPRPR